MSSALAALPLAEREEAVRRLEEAITRALAGHGHQLSETELLDQVAAEERCSVEDVAYAAARLGALHRV